MAELSPPEANDPWKAFERRGQISARPYVPGEDLADVSISDADQMRPSLIGGYIARNPDNHNDQWYINPEYMAKHYFERNGAYALKDMKPENTLREFLYAGMMAMFVDREIKPGIAGSVYLNGTVYEYELAITKVILPHRSDLDTRH